MKIKKGDSSNGKSGKGGEKKAGMAKDDFGDREAPPVIKPPTKHALLAPCCKLCRGDFEGMKPPSDMNLGNPFPPPARRSETLYGEGYNNFMQISSSATTTTTTTASSSSKHRATVNANVKVGAVAFANGHNMLEHQQTHRRQQNEEYRQQRQSKLVLQQPKEQYNKVLSSETVKKKMQKTGETKTLVDAAKVGAQVPIALNYPHCCPICPPSRFNREDYQDIPDVPTVLPGSFLQIEFQSRMQKFVGAAGAAMAGPLGGMLGGLLGKPVCPKGGGCVMCPNPRSELPPFGEPLTHKDEMQNEMAVFANKITRGYQMEHLFNNLVNPGDAMDEKVTTSDASGMNCQQGLVRNLRNKRPCKAVLGNAESREANLNLGDSGPGER